MAHNTSGSIRPPADQDWVWDNGVLKWGDFVWDTWTQLWKDPKTNKFYDTEGKYLPDVGPDANKPPSSRWTWNEIGKSIKPPDDQDWVWDNGVLKWGNKTWDELRQRWKDPDGNYYDTDGKPVSNVGDTPPGAKWEWIELPTNPGTGNPWVNDPFDKDHDKSSGGQKWNSGLVSERGRMQPTGQKQEFKPFGTVEDYSSEILRYGGPMSGQAGRFSGFQSPDMVELGGTTTKPTPPSNPFGTTPAGVGAPAGTTSPGGSNPASPTTPTMPNDGDTWTDPKTGQDYVWENNQWQKADLKNRLGPTTPGPNVTNTGGIGTEVDPIRLILGGSSDPTAALRTQAKILRNNQ